MALTGITDGDGSVATEPPDEEEETSDSGGSTTTFDSDTQTLGTTSLGTSTGDQDEEDTIEVTSSDSDPSNSSPAGGAGAEEATERFAGLDDETLDDSSTEEIVDVGNAASDAYTAHDRGNEDATQEAQDDLQEAVNAATGEEPNNSGTADSVGAKKAAAAILAGAAVVRGS